MAAGRGDRPHKAAACFSSGESNQLVHAAAAVVRRRLRPQQGAATAINAPAQILFIWSVPSPHSIPPGPDTRGQHHVRFGGVVVYKGLSGFHCFISDSSSRHPPIRLLSSVSHSPSVRQSHCLLSDFSCGIFYSTYKARNRLGTSLRPLPFYMICHSLARNVACGCLPSPRSYLTVGHFGTMMTSGCVL